METGYRTVDKLNHEELDELRMKMYDEFQYTEDVDKYLCYDAISEKEVKDYFSGINFVEEDFWCNLDESEID